MSFNTMARCAVPVAVVLAGSAVPANAEGGTLVPMRSILRACDFTPITDRASADRATATSEIHRSGSSVSADVHFAEPSAPGAHYDVALIQAPRASTSPCDGPGPGVAVGSLNTDGAGIANTTISSPLSSGTTGVWVFIRQANPYSQSPQEFYTSDFLVRV